MTVITIIIIYMQHVTKATLKYCYALHGFVGTIFISSPW